MLKNNDSYKLLFNQLWFAAPEKIKQLNPKLRLGEFWDFNSKVSTNLAAVEMATPIKDIQAKPQAEIPKVAPSSLSRTTSSSAPAKNTPTSPSLTHVLPKISTELIPNWEQLVSAITNCTKCKLCNGRKHVVIERGNRSSRWLFVGEGPGEEEDKQGLPFVGVSGQLLDKMIAAMKLDILQDIYICNVVKCRPPHNRNPEEIEVATCKSYLFSQINLVQPQIIVALGRFASQTLLNTNLATGKLRGTTHKFGIIPVIVTYHPSYLLRNPSAKKAAWEDLQLAMKVFGV